MARSSVRSLLCWWTLCSALPLAALGCGESSSGGRGDDGAGGANGGTDGANGGTGGAGGAEPTPTYGRYGEPGETFTLPKPGGEAPSLFYADVQESFPDVDWQKIDRLYLPAGDYARIHLGNLPERQAARPLVITNTGGRVKAGGHAAGHPLVLAGGKNWVLTGRYDPVSKTGHEDYVGHAAGRFANSQGTYGIVLDDEFSREGMSGLVVGGFASDFEIEMLEVTRAEFAGLLIKTDDEGGALMRRVRLHDLYVHDVGSEGLYLGSTQSQPQHAFEELEVYDNRFLRTGTEALQVGQLGSDCEIHHNVLGPAAIRWRSAFADYQDGNVQYGQRYGSSSFHHNIVIGTGDLFVEFFPQAVTGDEHGQDDEVIFSDNYFADSSLSGVYTHATANSVTIRFERNSFRGFTFDYDEVYPNATPPGGLFGVGSNTENPHLLRGNRFDAPFPFVQWTFPSVTQEDNEATEVPRPRFRDFMNAAIEENFRRVEWWTPTVTRHPERPARSYAEGDFVMHQGVLYRARAASSAAAPDAAPELWEELGVPADDARLTADSPHRGLGVRAPR